MVNRVILIVLDSVGVGALPDADQFGDLGSNTIGNIARDCPGLDLPNLLKMGLGHIKGVLHLDTPSRLIGAYGRALEVSPGKDTTTGHWEIAGLNLKDAFPTFPNGFPAPLIEAFEKAIGTKTLGNKTASGTVIIEELGKQHLKTGFPIVYTSADSVFQIAMHEELYPPKQQYGICLKARKILKGPYAVSRVIARPFAGKAGSFYRTSNRKDFSLKPPGRTLLDKLKTAGKDVIGIGKISDIFAGQGLTKSIHTRNNMEGIDQTLDQIRKDSCGLIMTNLVDFDMMFGHRRNVDGYAQALMEFDVRLPELWKALKPDDVLILTADHGNDPTFPGTDHTREFVPILVCGNTVQEGASIGTRKSFADIGATIADMLGSEACETGESFWEKIRKAVPKEPST
jgi:phosphopentomutase